MRLLAATLGVAAAVVGTTASLYTGAGTAQADSYCGPGPAETHVCVTYDNPAFGTTAHVWDRENNPGHLEHCHYHSNRWGDAGDTPYDHDFTLNGPTPSSWWIPGVQTGTKWDVTVTCDNWHRSIDQPPNNPLNPSFVQYF